MKPSHRLPAEAGPNDWSRRLAERHARGESVIDLTESNPTRVGLAHVDEASGAALVRAARAAYAPEPLGLATARDAVVRLHRERHGIELDRRDVALVASTSEAYAHLFRLLADPGDVILAPAPSYPLFEPLASLEGLRVETYRLAFDGQWHLDRESLARAIDAAGGKAKALVVVQPNHPTGSCLADDELDAIEDACARADITLIADEVFGEFPRPGAAALPSLIGERRVLTFVLGGLSKSCGLPQLKLSWIACRGPVAERERAMHGLEWIADLFLSVATPVQQALPTLLDGRATFQGRVHERIARQLERLDALAVRRSELRVLPADGGWNAVIRMPSRRTDEAWALALLEHGVVVHPGHFYDFADEHHLVLSLIVPEDTLADGLEKLVEVVDTF